MFFHSNYYSIFSIFLLLFFLYFWIWLFILFTFLSHICKFHFLITTHCWTLMFQQFSPVMYCLFRPSVLFILGLSFSTFCLLSLWNRCTSHLYILVPYICFDLIQKPLYLSLHITCLAFSSLIFFAIFNISGITYWINFYHLPSASNIDIYNESDLISYDFRTKYTICICIQVM